MQRIHQQFSQPAFDRSYLHPEEVFGFFFCGKSEKDVFELLKPHLAEGQLFEDQLINTWFEFVAIIQEDLPAIFEIIYTIVKLHYSDYDLAKVFVEGPHTADRYDIASVMEEVQLLKWKDAGKSEKDIFELMKLCASYL